jgi:hypothetical protein
MARLLLQLGLTADAAHFAAILENRFADATLDDGTAVEESIAKLRESGAAVEAMHPAGAVWPDNPLKIERVGGSPLSEGLQELKLPGAALPFFRSNRFELDPQSDRLAIVDAQSGMLKWLAPLRQSPRSKQDGYAAAFASGFRVLVLHRDVLHSFSPVTRELLWSVPVDVGGGSFGFYREPESQPVEPLQSVDAMLAAGLPARQAVEGGMVAFANSRYVGVHGRRRFSVLDALTGETVWLRDPVAPHTVVHATRDVVFIVSTDGGKTAALRISDGKPLEIPDSADLLTRAILVSEHGLLLLDEGASAAKPEPEGAETPRTVIRLYDPLSRRDRWRREFPKKIWLSLPENGWLPVFDPSGAFSLVSVETGEVMQVAEKLEAFASQRLTDVYVFQDNRNVYLAVSKRSRGRRYDFGEIASIPVNGPVFAFDRTTGAQLWKVDVSAKHLIYEQLRYSPVLVFAQRKYVQKGDVHQSWIDILCYNKQSGRKLTEASLALNSPFQSLRVNLRERYVELGSYDQRLRLLRADDSAEAAIAGNRTDEKPPEGSGADDKKNTQ